MATILIVEDDPEILSLMEISLTRAGHKVYSAPNGVDALYLASAYKPALIVLDLMMPIASGDAVLGFIRSTQELQRTRVLVISAHPEGAKLANQLDADAFLAKPVEMRAVLTQVNRLLGAG